MQHYRPRTGVTASAVAAIAPQGALTFPERFAAEQALTPTPVPTTTSVNHHNVRQSKNFGEPRR
jgi:hypothetical protein